jgi:dolichol-phosphate mannosyltransferase
MKILATLPTYNELGNIGPLMDELLSLDPQLEVLVVDDNSPDETWRLVQEKTLVSNRIHLIHRTGERGRGTAGLAAFRFARDNGYDAAVEMDADYSHHPRFIPSLLEPLRHGEADIVIGSRLVKGGGETGRHPLRRYITLAANGYIRFLLKLPVRDCTTGFRTFNRRALEAIPWENLDARGPEIVQEVLIEASRAGLRMVERPILFEERREGTSTFNYRIMARSFGYVWRKRNRN